MELVWKAVTNTRDSVFADVPGCGKFVVCRRDAGKRHFVVMHNGNLAGTFSDKADAMTAVERNFRNYSK